MTSRDFCFWLQGYLEITGSDGPLTESQVKCVRNHLGLVFKHEIDPSMGPPAHQAELNATHSPPKHNTASIEATPHWDGRPGPVLRC